MKSLADRIDALYAAFDEVPKPRVIDGCPCCVERKDICTLLSKPRRDLTPDEISSYAFSAFLTAGSIPDYLYFLPRIIEISCTVPGWWPDPPITGRAIAETNPGAWPSDRRIALLDVLHAIIDHAVTDDESFRDLDDWMCAIGKMGFEVTPFLTQIEASPTALLSYHERNSQSLVKQKLANPFWDKEDPGHDTILDWFNSPRLAAMISEADGR